MVITKRARLGVTYASPRFVLWSAKMLTTSIYGSASMLAALVLWAAEGGGY
jgi:hypothetical protein